MALIALYEPPFGPLQHQSPSGERRAALSLKLMLGFVERSLGVGPLQLGQRPARGYDFLRF